MNIKNLTQYDVKNIDVNKLLGNAYQRKDFLINIGLLVVTIFMSIHTANNQANSANQLTVSISDLENKIKATKELDSANLQFAQFFEKLPKGISESDEIVTAINNHALKNDIYISSFFPKGQDKNDYFTKNKIQLNFTVTRFEDLGQFVYDLENSHMNLRVDRFQATIAPKQSDRYSRNVKFQDAQQEDNTITVDMEISAIALKEKK